MEQSTQKFYGLLSTRYFLYMHFSSAPLVPLKYKSQLRNNAKFQTENACYLQNIWVCTYKYMYVVTNSVQDDHWLH